MSTHVNDLASAVAVYAALPPAVRTAGATGPALDLLSADGPCFAVQQVGTISAGASWTGALEESANGTAWTAIDGAEFESVATSGDLQTITFRRTKRYVRYAGTIAGASPSVPVAVVVGQGWKTF